MQSKDKTEIKQNKAKVERRVYCQSLGFSQTLYDCFIAEAHRMNRRSLICIVSGLLFTRIHIICI